MCDVTVLNPASTVYCHVWCLPVSRWAWQLMSLSMLCGKLNTFHTLKSFVLFLFILWARLSIVLLGLFLSDFYLLFIYYGKLTFCSMMWICSPILSLVNFAFFTAENLIYLVKFIYFLWILDFVSYSVTSFLSAFAILSRCFLCLIGSNLYHRHTFLLTSPCPLYHKSATDSCLTFSSS
jgi:hypothetical protein